MDFGCKNSSWTLKEYGSFFIVLSISINNNNIVIIRLIAVICEHADITKNKCDRSRNTGSQMIRQIGKNPNPSYLEAKTKENGKNYCSSCLLWTFTINRPIF